MELKLNIKDVFLFWGIDHLVKINRKLPPHIFSKIDDTLQLFSQKTSDIQNEPCKYSKPHFLKSEHHNPYLSNYPLILSKPLQGSTNRVHVPKMDSTMSKVLLQFF